MSEYAAYFRPAGLDGIEALHARFVRHAYRPHSHPTWTVAVVERGAARFTVDATDQRAGSGELFVLEPDAVHTGMAAVPEGWQYKVLYVEPDLLPSWEERDARGPRAARWTVFRDRALRAALLDAHRALADEPPGLAVDEAVLRAVAGLRPHLRPGPPRPGGGRGEHAAVRRAVAHLEEPLGRAGAARRAVRGRGPQPLRARAPLRRADGPDPACLPDQPADRPRAGAAGRRGRPGRRRRGLRVRRPAASDPDLPRRGRRDAGARYAAATSFKT